MTTADLGYLAAFATAVCWTITAIFFTRAADRAGSLTVNRARLLLAVPMIMAIHLVARGDLFPTGVGLHRWGWLGLSGVIGLVLGDSCLFGAFVRIGPRLSLLIMSLVPILSTTAAWIFLSETLAPREITGVLVAVAGIAGVVNERTEGRRIAGRKRYGIGILLALGGAFGQALGLVVAKKGMEGGFPAISANLIRMCAAAAVMWAVAFLRGQAIPTIAAISNPRVLPPLLVAVGLGSALGIWLSLVSILYARLGIAATLMALPPVLILPLARWQLGERVSIRALLGTLVAFAGIAILLLN